MTLIGMSAETWQKIIDEVDEIRFLVSLSGEDETSRRVGEILVVRHNLSLHDVRSFIRLSCNEDFPYCLSENGPKWTANRPEPKIEDYPEVAEFLREK